MEVTILGFRALTKCGKQNERNCLKGILSQNEKHGTEVPCFS
jgi:hypothetical protein